MAGRATGGSPRSMARIAGVFYVLNIATSLIAFSGTGGRALATTSGHVATACYVAVTILFYYLFRPVNRSVSLVAAVFGLMGSAVGVLRSFHLDLLQLHPLVYFGFYCVLIGYLILRSTFLPAVLGVLMMIAGAGWLTFLSPLLAKELTPYHYAAGGIGEGLLTLWLVVAGVNERRWKEQAREAV